MRVFAVFMFSFAMASGASASSIVVLSGKPVGAPSIIARGEPGKSDRSIMAAGATEPGTTASPSVVVLGDPAVNAEKVAAIPAPRQQPRAGNVMVIRAGVAGGSSAAPLAKATATRAGGGTGNNGKAPTLRDAMTQAGRAPVMP